MDTGSHTWNLTEGDTLQKPKVMLWERGGGGFTSFLAATQWNSSSSYEKKGFYQKVFLTQKVQT